MSVYTTLSQEDWAQITSSYSLGQIQSYEGILAGVTNTIYRVNSAKGSYVLTLFESSTLADLEPILQLMQTCWDERLPVPEIIKTSSGKNAISLQGKPAVMVSFLPGSHPELATEDQCYSLGVVLAQFHLAGLKTSLSPRNTRDDAWHHQVAARISPQLNPAETDLLKQAMTVLDQHPLATCPQGIIHFDLFRDNVLMQGNQVTGFLDFYYSFHGPWILDLAVCINDWCRSPSSTLLLERESAFLQGYESIRPLEDQERKHLPQAILLAALRFWLSRKHDQLFPLPGNLVLTKDPFYFEKILQSELSI